MRNSAPIVVTAELDRAVVVSPSEVPADVVTMNSRVRVRDGRRSWTMTLVFPERADAEQDFISVLAPIGAAVLGAWMTTAPLLVMEPVRLATG